MRTIHLGDKRVNDTYTIVFYNLVTSRADQRYHSQTMCDKLVRKNGRIDFDLYKVDSWLWSHFPVSRQVCHRVLPMVGISAITTRLTELASLD